MKKSCIGMEYLFAVLRERAFVGFGLDMRVGARFSLEEKLGVGVGASILSVYIGSGSSEMLLGDGVGALILLLTYVGIRSFEMLLGDGVGNRKSNRFLIGPNSSDVFGLETNFSSSFDF